MADADSVLARLQSEAAFGRAVLDLVKGSGLAKPKRRKRKVAEVAVRKAKASRPTRVKTAVVRTEESEEE